MTHDPRSPGLHVVWSDPLGRLLVHLGLSRRPLMRVTLALGVAWLPLWLITWSHGPEAMNALVLDYEVHLRLLVAVPLLIGMANPIDHVVHATARVVSNTELLTTKAREKANVAVERATRLSSSSISLWVCTGLMLLGPWFVEHAQSTTTPWRTQAPGAVQYYYVVAGTLTRFLIARMLWRWFVWCDLVVRLSFLDWQLRGTHPDSTGGLSILTFPSLAAVPLPMAFAALLAGHWASLIERGATSLPLLAPLAATFLGGALLLLTSPLMCFMPRAYHRRLYESARYAQAAVRIASAFEHKWLDRMSGQRDATFLETNNFSATADFSTTYQNCARWRLFAFSKEQLLQMSLLVLLPLLPVVLLVMPWREVVGAVASVLF